MTDNEERQELELSSLKHIYPEIIDLRTERKTTHQTTQNRRNNRQPSWRPLDVQITLKPNSENIYVQVDLHVKCTQKYPKEAPELIEIKNVSGLANSNVQQLENELIELSKDLAEKDEESLFMCISKVEEFLNENNKPPGKSFYDQMLSNQLKQQEEEERLRLAKISEEKKKEEELSKVLKQAMSEKQKLLESERLRRSSFMEEDSITSSIVSLKNSISNLKARFLVNLSSFKGNTSEEVKSIQRTCQHDHQLSVDSFCKFKTSTGKEFQVQKLACDLHSDIYTDYFAIQRDSSTAFYLLSEFQSLKLNVSKEEKTKLMKEIQNIRTKFEHKSTLLNHVHIIQPLAFTYSLPIILNNFEQQQIKSSFYFIQILDALNYLHSNHLAHGHLNTENIMVDLQCGKIKLLNPLIQSYVYDFINQLNSTNKSFSQSIEQDYNRDYVSFGFLLCWFKLRFKFTFNQLLSFNQTDLIKMLQDCGCVGSELELIKNCLNSNTSITVLEPILIEYFEQAAENINENLNKTTRLMDEIESDQITGHNNLKDFSITSKNSRLSDFEIISKLGQGGFGEVYKVRNNLDHQLCSEENQD